MKKKILGIAGIAVVGAAAILYMSMQGKAVEVSTALVQQGNILEYVEESGTVKVQNYENVYAPISGKISEILVDIGDDVSAGDVLIKLDGEDIARQLDALEAQRAALSAQYSEALSSNDITKEKLELSIIEMKKNVATAEKATNDSKALFEMGGISEDEYKAAVRNLETQRNALAQLQLDLKQLNQSVSENIIAGYEAQLKQLDIQRSGLEKSKQEIIIKAGLNGKVLQKSVEKGSYLQAGMPVMEIGSLNNIYIESDLLMGDMANVREGSRVQISNKDLGLAELEGLVKKIHPLAFSKTSDLGVEQKRVKIEISMASIDTQLRPGYDVAVRVITNSKENVLILRESAVFQIEGQDYVFVNENNKAVLRAIKTGLESERMVEVLEGLAEGDRVILSPDEKIKEGSKIISIVEE